MCVPLTHGDALPLEDPHDVFLGVDLIRLARWGKRMHLEDVHEAWVRHTEGTEEPLQEDNNGAHTGMDRILLPCFLDAFTALAKTKYRNLHEGKGGNHLLLSDVFDNITDPTVS